jgi:hypothetical protein
VCTVSIVPRADGFRLVCNRDESRARPLALPPVRRISGGVPLWHPRDPQGGGTWIAVNGHGVGLALLNRQPPVGVASIETGPPGGSELRSRGQLVLQLADIGTPRLMREALRTIEPHNYAAFRLVAVLRSEVLVATSDRRRLTVEVAPLIGPLVLTSSSWGDGEAERRRLPLFRDLVLENRDRLAGQQAFHDHRWLDCPEFSVRMRRADARTVSRTTVDVTGRHVSLSYEPLPLED